MAKKRVKRKTVAAPQDASEANEYMQRLGELVRTIDNIEARANNQIERIKAAAVKEVARWEKTLAECAGGLAAYAEANRKALTTDGKTKTVRLPAGDIIWRLTPMKVTITTSNKEVVQDLVRRHLKRFIRATPVPNKEAMLRDPEAAKKVTGVSIVQNEVLVLKPTETKVEVESRAGKLKRVAKEEEE